MDTDPALPNPLSDTPDDCKRKVTDDHASAVVGPMPTLRTFERLPTETEEELSARALTAVE